LKTQEEIWSYYYLPLVELIASQDQFHSDQPTNEPLPIQFDALDIKIGIYPPLLKYLISKEYSKARGICHVNSDEIKEAGYQADGIQVIAGQSWRKPFTEFSEFTND
jgi:hypothetical protein